VIPLFIDQIAAGQPLTVTDPNMTRFLMSLDDAVDLVLFAFEHGQQGDTFVQKAPASTIADLATALCELFDAESDVKTIGTRHGEKLYETLLTREEMTKAIDLPGYYRIPADNRDLNYNKYFVEGETNVSEAIDYNSHNTQRLNIEEIKEKLMTLEYVRGRLNGFGLQPVV
jgi:UDP-glucose 4-epimerase